MHSFYREFEERHRGSRELIRSRFEIYLPFVIQCRDLQKKAKVIDLGCGRGEWIEMLAQLGMETEGVDLDDGMLEACRELKLNVVKADIFDYLKRIKSESVSIVSAFHVVEHIPFDLLYKVIKEIFRVLVPGGLLVFETPNSENITVGTSSFYMDPTHQKPVPSALLSFVVEYAGFERTKVLYLQESPDVIDGKKIGLFGVLSGASADYGIVAQKKTLPIVMEMFDAAFSRDYGVRLKTLAEKYDAQIQESLSALEAKTKEAEKYAHELKNEISRVKKESLYLERMTCHWWSVADKFNKEIRENKMIRQQNFTLPAGTGKTHKLLELSGNSVRRLLSQHWRSSVRRMVLQPAHLVYQVPWIRRRLHTFIAKYPRLRNFLRRIMYSHEEYTVGHPYFTNHEGLSGYEARICRLIQKESEICGGDMNENRN